MTEALNLAGTERAALLTSARAGDAPDAPDAAAYGFDAVPPDSQTAAERASVASPNLAELLRGYRQSAHLTQAALAEKAGLSVRAISDLERGIRRFPLADTLQRLVEALGLAARDRALLEAAANRLGLPCRPVEPNRPVATVRHNLPVELTSFVGRVQEIADVRRKLARTRLLTLTGPGGVGKTRLGLRVAAEESDGFADGAWFAELAPVTEASLVPQSIATLFDVREKPDEPLIASLAAAVQARHVLLILDNCEHLLEACTNVVPRLLRVCPHLVVMATSREVLGLSAETVWRVPPLRVRSSESEAAELFVEHQRNPWKHAAKDNKALRDNG